MLTVTFGCPAGDDGETDANTTMASTGHDTEHNHDTSDGGQTTDEGGQTTDDGGSTTDEGGQTTDDGGSTTDGGETETETGVSAECTMFCERYFNTCGDDPGNDYGDVAGCETACGGWDAAGLECRTMHLGLAMDDPGTHCPHASNGGGGIC